MSPCFQFLWVHTQKQNSWIIWWFYLYIFEEPSNSFPQWLHHLNIPSWKGECSISPRPYQDMSFILFDLVYSIYPSPWVRKIPWRRAWQPTLVFNPMERGDWKATVHRVTKSQTQLKWLSTHIYVLVGMEQYLTVAFICISLRANDQLRQHIKKQRHYFANKGPSGQSRGFSNGHVWMWELDYKGSWALKNWCFWTVVLEKTLESPVDCKEIKPVHPKGKQSWIFFARTDAEAEAPIPWLPDAKNWLIWKDLDAGKDWRQEEKGTTEDEMAGWHHRLNGHEFE